MDAWSDQSEIEKKISEIKKRSANGEYIYRGEPEYYKKHPYCGKVSSNLWRELEFVKAKYSNIKKVQADIVAAARAYYKVGIEDYQILTDLQHYGGKTNLIDFTTDYDVALFFACYGSPGKDGRVTILQVTEEVKLMLSCPLTPANRVRAQKSVFVEPPKGYIEQKYEVVCIPKDLKLGILQYLQTSRDINPAVIYNDIHGFIRSQNADWMAYREFYSGFISQNNSEEVQVTGEKRKALEEAIKHYTNALELNLQLPAVYYNLGLVHYAKQEYDRAVDDFTKATGLKPNYADAFNSRGVAYQINGDDERAIEDHSRAIQLKSNYAEAYNNRGIAYKSKGNLDRAIEDYNKAIELKPDYAIAYHNRGGIYFLKEEYDRAISDYKEAIKLESDNASAYFNRGVVYVRKGEADRAIADFSKAIILNSNDAEAYFNRGIAHINKKDYDCAIGDFDRVLELNPNHVETYIGQGLAHFHKGDYDRAITELNKAIEINSEFAEAYNIRGVTYSDKGKQFRAIEDYNRAIELKPDYAEAYNNRGVAYGKKGEIDGLSRSASAVVCAIKDYNSAIGLNAEFSTVFYNRGEAWLRLEEWEKAESDLIVAKQKGINLFTAFHNEYESVADFEERNGVNLPENIADMFTLSQH